MALEVASDIERVAGIFISYRREDSPYVERLHDLLSARFGEDEIVLDLNGISPGSDFTVELGRSIGSCRVLLAIVGPHWLNTIEKSGTRRLTRPHDFVNLEIQAALDHDIRVVPVLVGGAVLPSEDELPDSLSTLCHRQAFTITDEHFQHDAKVLIEELE